MQEMLQKILELDSQERVLTQQAEDLKTNTQRNIAEIKNELRQEYLDRARERVAKNAQQEREETETQWQKIQSCHEALGTHMDEILAQKKEEFISQIIANVLK